jgi:hypothetical protein
VRRVRKRPQMRTGDRGGATAVLPETHA